MEKFKTTLRGYDPDEVNTFLDQVIVKVEDMVKEIKTKDELLKQKQMQFNNLKTIADENTELKRRLDQYERMEATLNRAILMAQKTSDSLKAAAHKESEIIMDEAKKNANRIVNDALIRAQQAEEETIRVKRNTQVFKRRLKNMLDEQMEMVNDIEKLEL